MNIHVTSIGWVLISTHAYQCMILFIGWKHQLDISGSMNFHVCRQESDSNIIIYKVCEFYQGNSFTLKAIKQNYWLRIVWAFRLWYEDDLDRWLSQTWEPIILKQCAWLHIPYSLSITMKSVNCFLFSVIVSAVEKSLFHTLHLTATWDAG